MKAIVIEGPSCVGKSLVAFALAKKLKSSIVLADSMQLYKGFDVGSNKPSKAMLDQVQYHMLSRYDPRDYSSTSPLNVWKYREDAMQSLKAIWANGRIPVIEGGSHFYLKCLLYGREDSETVEIPPDLRTKVKQLIDTHKPDWEKSTALLKAEIPEIEITAGKNDFYRLEKAALMALIGKKNGRILFNDTPFKDARVFYLDMGNASLGHRINQRCEHLLQSGIVEETINLILTGQFNIKETHKLPENSIGYADTFDYITTLLKLLRSDHITDEDLTNAFYAFLDRLFYSTRSCVHYQRKTFRQTAKDAVNIRVNVDSYGELSVADIVSRIMRLTEMPVERFAEYQGSRSEVFHQTLEIDRQPRWVLYPRGRLHSSSAMAAVYRHMEMLQLHKDKLAALTL